MTGLVGVAVKHDVRPIRMLM